MEGWDGSARKIGLFTPDSDGESIRDTAGPGTDVAGPADRPGGIGGPGGSSNTIVTVKFEGISKSQPKYQKN